MGFSNVFDSSLVDYSKDFEKSDYKEYLKLHPSEVFLQYFPMDKDEKTIEYWKNAQIKSQINWYVYARTNECTSLKKLYIVYINGDKLGFYICYHHYYSFTKRGKYSYDSDFNILMQEMETNGNFLDVNEENIIKNNLTKNDVKQLIAKLNVKK